MPDIDNAAERISRVMQGESIESVYGPDGMDRLCMDHKMLVCAYLAQSPSYTAQAAEIQRSHEALSRMSIGLLNEDRSDATLSERVERLARRCESAEESAAELAELRAKLEAAEKEAALRSDMIDSDCMAAINTLRLNEGNSVTLICDNPDFGGPNNAIECSGDWTNWQTKRFTGDRLLTSLQSALKAYFAWHGEEWEPTKQLTALRTAAAPFEDSRVVDRDWLIANGFERADDTLPVFIRRINDVTVEAYCYKSKVSITVYDDYNAASRNYVKLLTNPTIGQLNHLLAALKPGGAK